MEMEKLQTIPYERSRAETGPGMVDRGGVVLSFGHWSFEFVSGFGFRISDFSLQRPAAPL
jgi:hypothetical protein